MKAIISGGGTGGHIFPAIAIAGAIKRKHPDADILFIGAEGRMEMEKVPAAGYVIKALPIAGLQRRLTLKNLALPLKWIKSRSMVKKIIRSFNPDIVVGVGGYASAPTLKTAARMGYPTLLQEQNSYPGLTNKMLSKSARTICVAYEGMETFFPKEKIVLTGNPVRELIENIAAGNADATQPERKKEGLQHFGLDESRKTVLSVGGSLGAGSINRMIMDHLEFFRDNNIQIIWQTGRYMHDEAVARVKQAGVEEWVKVHQFISEMDKAYSAADVIISRAGAIAISELCMIGKPVILIPSPNVAEDHQTKNAMALANKGAAMMVRDDECHEKGLPEMKRLLDDPTLAADMGGNILKLARLNAADRIVDEIDKIVDTEKRDKQ